MERIASDEEIEQLISARHSARCAGDYGTSDRILCDLRELGVSVTDNPLPSGKFSTWVRVKNIPETNILQLVKSLHTADLCRKNELCVELKSQLNYYFHSDGTPLSLNEFGLHKREIQG